MFHRTAGARHPATLILIAVGLIVGSHSLADRAAAAPTRARPEAYQLDLPAAVGTLESGPHPARATRGDTLWFGDYEVIGGEYYARSAWNDRESVMWTFDRGNGPFDPPDPYIHLGEGWRVFDRSANPRTYFRRIDSDLDLGQGVAPPILEGAASMWIGADKPEADSLCWACGPGYGNDWCQRLISPELEYNGSGSVTLTFRYFQKSEDCYDGTQVFLRRSDNSELMLNPYPTGTCQDNLNYHGGFTGTVGSHLQPAVYSRAITPAEMEGTPQYRIVIEFRSDGGYSDEDCSYATSQGPFGFDLLTLNGGGANESYSFESDLEGWTPGLCSPVGDYVGIADIQSYDILDPCVCGMTGNVLELHQDSGSFGVHPVDQHVWIESPICDSGNSDLKEFFAFYTQYAQLPMVNGVEWRIGWRYFPYTCEVTGATGWSDRVGKDVYGYTGADPICGRWFSSASQVYGGTSVPPTARAVRLIYELLSCCACFTIEDCSGITNFTPLLDNLAVGVVSSRAAPIITQVAGHQFNDAGSHLDSDPGGSALFNPRKPGPADISAMVAGGGSQPIRRGDSLVVTGPMPNAQDPNTQWEARLWWRVAKRSPFQADKENGLPSRYKTWKDRVSDGRLIDRPYRPQFTWGWMDSNQTGVIVMRDRFVSNFRENDDDFAGEGTAENEMLWDDVFYPGTRIEYFISSNYTVTPNVNYIYPDTSGGYFGEFEILPGIRTARVPNCGGAGFDYCAYQPATLLVTAGWTHHIEYALRTILNGEDPCQDEDGCALPADRNWDEYQYHDAASSWHAPFARGTPGSDNGMTLNQLLGYRTILLYAGGAGATADEDYDLYSQWLITPLCASNAHRQVFVANGYKVGEMLESHTTHGLPFLTNVLGATLYCDAFNGISEDPDCLPENLSSCLRVLPAAGGAFGTEIDVDAIGNGCPQLYRFNVFRPNGAGAGNRYYEAEDGSKMEIFEEVTNQDLSASGNYRTVLRGVPPWALTVRDPGQPPGERCPSDLSSIVAANISELGAALKWGHGVSDYSGIPKLSLVEELAACQGTWSLPSDAEEPANLFVDRLYACQPNPFNPRTSIRFSLATARPATISIYDVGGRLVRRLELSPLEAGFHSVVWDGCNDRGDRVGAGLYWVRMSAGSFASTMKATVVK